MKNKTKTALITSAAAVLVGGALLAADISQQQQVPRCPDTGTGVSDYNTAFENLKACAIANQYTQQEFTDAKNAVVEERPDPAVELPSVSCDDAVEACPSSAHFTI